MTYLTAFSLLLPKTFANEVILVDTNKIIKGPDIDFGEFLQFIGLWILMTANPETNQLELFSEHITDVFSECSIHVNRFVSDNHFESI